MRKFIVSAVLGLALAGGATAQAFNEPPLRCRSRPWLRRRYGIAAFWVRGSK